MDKRSRIYSVVFSVLFVITIVSGVTLAIYTWQSISDEDSIIEGDSACFDINYFNFGNIGSDEEPAQLRLGNSFWDGQAATVQINIDPKCTDVTGVATLYLNTSEETSDNLINSNALYYDIVIENVSVKSGIVNTKESIPVYENFNIGYDVLQIDVFVWINGNNVDMSNLDDVIGSTYKGNITASAESR